MHSLPSIFCRSWLFLPLAAILLCTCPALAQPAAAQLITYLGPDVDGRQLFKIESPLAAALVPGDRLGPCKVTESGIDCPPSSDSANDSKTTPDDSSCSDRLQRQKEEFQRRYLRSLEEYSENLRRKNYELVETNRQLQELRGLLPPPKGEGSMIDGKKHGTSAPSAATTSSGSKQLNPGAKPGF